jgi:HPt (histidine-containing phosphotransfer) domain-containing protein
MPEGIVERIDPELADLVGSFLAGSRRDAALLAEALSRVDMETAQRIGHSAKGAGAAYGFFGLRDLGGRLEQAAAQGDLALSLDLLQRIQDYLERVRVEYA